MTELKEIKLTDNTFEANGKKYLIESRISVARKILADKYMLEIGSGISMSEHFNDLKKMWELCNNQKFADIAVMLHNKMQGIKDWKEHKDPVISLCALYVNTIDEDRRYINDEQIAAKIKDWTEAGIPYDFFLACAGALLKEQLRIWGGFFPNSSPEGNNESQKAQVK